MQSYLAFPRQVILVVSAFVQRDEEVGAGVAIGERDAGGGHLSAGRFCWAEDGTSANYCAWGSAL